MNDEAKHPLVECTASKRRGAESRLDVFWPRSIFFRQYLCHRYGDAPTFQICRSPPETPRGDFRQVLRRRLRAPPSPFLPVTFARVPTRNSPPLAACPEALIFHIFPSKERSFIKSAAAESRRYRPLPERVSARPAPSTAALVQFVFFTCSFAGCVYEPGREHKKIHFFFEAFTGTAFSPQFLADVRVSGIF